MEIHSVDSEHELVEASLGPSLSQSHRLAIEDKSLEPAIKSKPLRKRPKVTILTDRS